MGTSLRKTVAIVIPTIRPESLATFLVKWDDLIKKHNAEIVVVADGETPYVEVMGSHGIRWLYQDLLPLTSHFTSAIRNLGFYHIWKYMPDIEYIITLDDDLAPVGDPIEAHISALQRQYPVSWMSTTIVSKSTDYMRGFPYGVREEAKAVLSHGIWTGTPDYDAPTQLHTKEEKNFYAGPVPKGTLFPMCGMNLAFTRDILPLVYFAPMGQKKGAERFDDIWGGIELKRDIDRLGLCAVTGMATVFHERASNVFKNLLRESEGIVRHENFDQDEWYQEFVSKRNEWKKLFT